MPSDLDASHRLLAMPDVRRYLMDGDVAPRNWVRALITATVRDRQQGRIGLWAVRDRAHGPLIGLCGFKAFSNPRVPELIYALAPPHWGKGIAVQVSQILCVRAFAAGISPVLATTDAPNTASEHVMKRLNMRPVAVRPNRLGRQVVCELPKARFSRSRPIRSDCAVLLRP